MFCSLLNPEIALPEASHQFRVYLYCFLLLSLGVTCLMNNQTIHSASSAIAHVILLQAPAELVFWEMAINHLVMICSSYHTRVKQRQRQYIKSPVMLS